MKAKFSTFPGIMLVAILLAGLAMPHRVAAAPEAVAQMSPSVSASQGTNPETVELTWKPAAGSIPTYWLVSRSESLNGPKTSYPHGRLAFSVMGGADQWAAPGVLYYYWVTACDSQGCSLPGVATGWRGQVDPQDVTASDGTDSDGVQVRWLASPAATSYKVYRAASGVAPTAANLVGTVTTLNHLDTTASIGVIYDYYVTACQELICSDLSTAQHDSGWRALAAPKNVSATDGTDLSGITVRWDAVPGAAGYLLSRSSESPFGVKTALDWTTATSIVQRNATPGVTYYFFIQATFTPPAMAEIRSAYSTPESGWLGIDPPEIVPTPSRNLSTWIDVNWIAGPDYLETHYFKVYRSTSLTGPRTFGVDLSGTNGQDTWATPGVVYYYWVKECVNSHCSPLSNGNENTWGIRP